MHSLKPHFAIVEPGVCVDDLYVTFTQAFDLATLQHDAGFNHIQNGVVVTRLTIAGDEFGAGGRHVAVRLRHGREADTCSPIQCAMWKQAAKNFT